MSVVMLMLFTLVGSAAAFHAVPRKPFPSPKQRRSQANTPGFGVLGDQGGHNAWEAYLGIGDRRPAGNFQPAQSSLQTRVSAGSNAGPSSVGLRSQDRPWSAGV